MFRLSNTIIMLLGASLAPSSMAFSAKTISWNEYKNVFIDPIASPSSSDQDDAPLEGHMDPALRQSSDQFWLAYYAQEKQRLHELNNHAAAAQLFEQESSSLPQSESGKVTSYNVYKSKYLDPMADHAHPSGLSGKMDPETRAKADEFWLQVVMEEKSKLHGKSSATP